MREIVIGPLTKGQGGIQLVNVWFRFAVPAARQSYYAASQASLQPQAPGDYAGADAAEKSGLQAGQWVEKPGFQDVIDPTSALPTIQARLVNIYNAAAAQFVSDDNAALARWASAWDGAAWTMKSA